jgi:hypothetical protein
MFWGKVMADDTKKHLRQIDQRKMERRQNNATVQSYLKDQMVQ